MTPLPSSFFVLWGISMLKPRLMDYNIKTLVILGNQAYDEEYREVVKKTLVKKMSDLNYSIMFLLNSFISAKGILREVYAELLMITIHNNKFDLPDVVTDEIIKLVSIDTLTKYGMESLSEKFREKCINEFWERAIEQEDKIELVKKRMVDSPFGRLIVSKKKGD